MSASDNAAVRLNAPILISRVIAMNGKAEQSEVDKRSMSASDNAAVRASTPKLRASVFGAAQYPRAGNLPSHRIRGSPELPVPRLG
jgi:hypothetical protein